MATRLSKRTVVIVGGGLTAALVARQLTAKGTDVLLLERGYDRRKSAEAKLPNQRDELRWDIRGGLGQNWAVETYTVRHSPQDEALPARRLAAFLPGEGLGGAASHWNGLPGAGRSTIPPCDPALRAVTAPKPFRRNCRFRTGA